jgi:anti-anti-sigma factor
MQQLPATRWASTADPPPVDHRASPGRYRAEDVCPVRWTGRRAVVELPEQVGLSNSGQIREELLAVINRGADTLIVDMTACISCDHAGADALARAHQRASVSGTELRLVVTAQIVRRVLDISGIGRLVPVYPCLEAAMAARAHTMVLPLPPRPAEAEPDGHGPRQGGGRAMHRPQAAGSLNGHRTAITPAVMWKLIDALPDGVVLADGDGVLVLANRQMEEMFGYQQGELSGHPIAALIPADLRAAHHRHLANYVQAPEARPMGAGARLVGLRKDGTTFPVEISLSPIPTTGRLTLAVVRDATQTGRQADLLDMARAAVATGQAHRLQELLDGITARLYHLGLSLQTASGLPAGTARQAIADALQHLDDTLREIRDSTFPDRD